MSATAYHPEDIRAELRKRHGTIGAFARARDLKPQQLADWFRGRTSAPVAKAIADELGIPDVAIEAAQSMKMDDSAKNDSLHRQNAEAR